MALSPISDDWSTEIFQAAQEFFNGELRVMLPGTPGQFDPDTNTTTGGTDPTVVIDWRAARAQHIRLPLENNDGNGWSTKRRFRFQCELRENDPIVHKGMYVEFRGGKDHTLEEFAFQVTSAVNSSHAALRTIETTTEAGT